MEGVTMRLAAIMIIFSLFVMPQAYASRIKDIASIAGVRENQLVGYGLVVGLDGTGDKTSQTPFTQQTFKNMLIQFGIKLPAGLNIELKNVAAVAVSANLPAFAKPGQKLDITVSSLGNATSLRGGELLMTPLRGADNQVYAVGQGSVVVSGFGAAGSDGSKVTVNSTSTGRIPNGATVEKTVETLFVKNGVVTFELNEPDFTTAQHIATSINKMFNRRIANPVDATSVDVHLAPLVARPLKYAPRISDYKDEDQYRQALANYIPQSEYIPYIASIENINMPSIKNKAKIIVNSRTGTIVVDENITITPVAVAHGNLSVVVSERPFVSQPNAFGTGSTVTGTASDINVNQAPSRAFTFESGASLKDLVDQINRVGAAPGDLIAILEAIKRAGAMQADLEVI